MINWPIIWIFSSVLAWAFTGSATPMGDTITGPGYRKFIRIFALVISIIALATTPFVSQAFVIAYNSIGIGGFTASMAYSFLLWAFIHLSGALYTVVANGHRLVTNTL